MLSPIYEYKGVARFGSVQGTGGSDGRQDACHDCALRPGERQMLSVPLCELPKRVGVARTCTSPNSHAIVRAAVALRRQLSYRFAERVDEALKEPADP